MRSVNLDEAQILEAGSRLTGLLQELERTIRERPIASVLDRSELARLREMPFSSEGIGIDRLFSEIRSSVIPNSTNTAHPRFLAYVLGPSNGIAPFADAIASALNQNCNFWQLSPAANAIEQNVISWLAAQFEYPDTAGGLLTSGGSMATLIALSTGLHAHASRFRESGLQRRRSTLVAYASAEAHQCVEKCAAILGLGTDHVRRIPTDAACQLRIDQLSSAIDEDRRRGDTPFCVVASAGTVTTGAIDPIDELAQLCQAHRLWLHVDAAYGGLFVLSARVRHQLLPCGRADSIALDPHKLLFAPLEAGSLLVRDRRSLERAFRFEAAYLPDDDDPLLTNFMHAGPELSRRFKAFKVWCALRAFGVGAFVAAVDHTIDMARLLERRLTESGVCEVVAPAPLTAVCFRVSNHDDAFQRRVVATLRGEGTAFAGLATVRGRLAIRACVANYRTTASDIDYIVDRLVALADSRSDSHGDDSHSPGT
jgi:aromatic-L-amino-acid decarboxylase